MGEMFEDLARYQRIAVTGPQRSGTTIAAQAIAADIGHRFVDEFDFEVFDVGKFLRVLFSGEPVVVQCPHMVRYLVDLKSPEIFVVLMRRSLEDIERSAQRVGWGDDLGAELRDLELEIFGLSEGDPAAVKYDYWDTHGKVPHFVELEYESLAEHPLYISAEQRKDFLAKQTTLERGSGELGSNPSPTNGGRRRRDGNSSDRRSRRGLFTRRRARQNSGDK